MKRDMELVRKLLVLIEDKHEEQEELILPNDIDRNVAANHLVLMEQAGLVKNNITYADNKPYWIRSSLTWEGHEFLDSIRNEGIWNKVKEGVKVKGLEIGSVPLEVLKEYAKMQIKNIFGLS